MKTINNWNKPNTLLSLINKQNIKQGIRSQIYIPKIKLNIVSKMNLIYS